MEIQNNDTSIEIYPSVGYIKSVVLFILSLTFIFLILPISNEISDSSFHLIIIWLFLLMFYSLTSFFIIYLYNNDFIEKNKHFKKYFKSIKINFIISVLILGYMILSAIGCMFGCEDDSFMYPIHIIPITILMISFIYSFLALKTIKKIICMIFMLLICFIFILFFGWYSRFLGYINFNNSENINNIVYNNIMDNHDAGPEQCKLIKGTMRGVCYSKFLSMDSSLGNPAYCEKIRENSGPYPSPTIECYARIRTKEN